MDISPKNTNTAPDTNIASHSDLLDDTSTIESPSPDVKTPFDVLLSQGQDDDATHFGVSNERTGEERMVDQRSFSFSLFGGAVFAFGIILFFGMLFSGGQRGDSVSLLPTVEVLSGSLVVQDNFSQRNVDSASPVTLSGTTFLRTNAESEAVISFAQDAQVRLNADTTVQVSEANETLEITLAKGNIWIAAADRVKVRSRRYEFLVDDGSASFITDVDKTIAKVWDNTLEVLIGPDYETVMFLPMLSQGVFPESEKLALSSETVQRLRFSKLLKEFRVANLTATQWDQFQREKDEFWRQELVNDVTALPQKFSHVSDMLRASLTVFDAREQENTLQKWEAQKYQILSDLSLPQTSGAALELVQRISLSDQQEKELMKYVQIGTQSFVHAQIRHILEDRQLARLGSDERAEFVDTMLRNAFHGLQQAFISEDSEWGDQERARIEALWRSRLDSSSEEFDSSLVSFHRENLFRLFLNHPQEVDLELLQFLEFLDTAEIELSSSEEKTTAQLEIISRALALANVFIPQERTELAHAILEKSESVLAQIDIDDSRVAFQNTLQQKENLQTRLLSCESLSICQNGEFRDWLQERRLVACQLSGVCSSEGFDEWVVDFLEGNLRASTDDIDPEEERSDIDPFVRAQTLLQSSQIRLEEGAPDGLNGFFRIIRATTESGYEFSALLSLNRVYLKDIQLADGSDIVGIFAPSNLDTAIGRAKAESDVGDVNDTDQGQVDTGLSAEIRELLVLDVQPKLIENGIVVFRSAIVPQSGEQGVVREASIEGNEAIRVRFEYELSERSGVNELVNVEFVDFADLSIDRVSLDEARDRITQLFETGQKEQRLIQSAQYLLQRNEVNINNAIFSANVETGSVRFENVFWLSSEESFSGVIDPETGVLRTVSVGEEVFSDISVDQLGEIF